MKKWFTITQLCREDLNEHGFTEEQAKKVEDHEMEWLARKIEDALMETGVYWEVIKEWSKDYKLRKEEK